MLLLSLILIPVVVLILSVVGFSLMINTELSGYKTVHMYTTANEAYPVYKKLFMQSVCMKVSESSTINWVLYTSTCDKPKSSDINQRSYVVSGMTATKTTVGYYFYFIRGSFISEVTPSTVKVKYAETTNVEEAATLAQACANSGKDLITKQPFEDIDHGYYYICISATETPVEFKLHVTEYYFDIRQRHTCDNTEHEDGALQKCCDFSFSFNHECVFISANSTSSVPLTSPVGVEVRMKFNDVMKTVLVMIALGAVILPLLALLIWCCIKCL